MYKNLHLYLLLCIPFLLVSGCFQKEHPISTSALEAIPYRGGERLVYASSIGKTDTLFIQEISSAMVKGGDPFSINPDSYEHQRVVYTTSQKKQPQGLVSLSNWDKTFQLNFEFDAGHSRLFGYNIITKPEYDKLPDTTLLVLNKRFTDVKIVGSGEFYDDRLERIVHFYWSTSSGLLGWDTPDTQWRLKEIK